MKKINLFLWGIVSTCITFFYRTEICAAGVSYSISMNSIATCDGKDEDVDNVKDNLSARVTTRTLCPSNQIFLGCYDNEGNRFELAHFSVGNVLDYCHTYRKAICGGDEVCPTPGTRQDSAKDTFIYLDTCLVVCSARYIVIQENGDFTHLITYDDEHKPIHYIQTVCLEQPRDYSNFGHINRLSNTCAINAGKEFTDDTGTYEYTNDCYYR